MHLKYTIIKKMTHCHERASVPRLEAKISYPTDRLYSFKYSFKERNICFSYYLCVFIAVGYDNTVLIK